MDRQARRTVCTRKSALATSLATAAGRAARCVVEACEPRVLFAATLTKPVADTAIGANATAAIELFENFNDTAKATVVRMTTDLGAFNIEMYDADAPRTVASFVNYVNSNRLNNTFFDRVEENFVLQSSGFKLPSLTRIDVDPRVPNEFSRDNLTATVSIPRSDGNPNSNGAGFFISLADNRSILNPQNGGFTAFGRVPTTDYPTLVSIISLDIVPLDLPQLPLLDDVPVQRNPPTSTADLVAITDASLVPELTFTVTTDRPDLVTPTMTDTRLTLVSAGSGLMGVANITVTATDADNNSVQDTFAVTVGDLHVDIGDDEAASVTYVDADGTTGTISLTGGGTSTVHFSGTDMVSSTDAKGVTVTGTNLVVEEVEILATNVNASKLTVKAKGGDGLLTVRGINSNGSVNAISARPVVVTGDVRISGSLIRLDLAALQDGTLDVEGRFNSGLSLTANIGAMRDADVISDMSIASITTGSSTSTDGIVDTINAPELLKLTSAGDFSSDVELNGYSVAGATADAPDILASNDLGAVKVGGALTAGTWRVAGNVGKLSAGSIGSGWSLSVAGTITSITSAGNLTGDIDASALGALKVGGNYTDSNLLMSQEPGEGPVGLGTVSVRGDVKNVILRTLNSVAKINVNSLTDSTIYVGVGSVEGNVLPTVLTDFTAAVLGSLTVKNKSAASFVDSNVAAKQIGKLNLGNVRLSNAAVPFGVAADSIASIAAVAEGGGAIKYKALATPEDAAAQTTALGFSLGDFVVRVL